MKRILSSILILILAGLVGVALGPSGVDIPGKIETKVAQATFHRHANAVIKCANDKLMYSTVLGFNKVSKIGIMVVVSLNTDPKTPPGDARFTDIIEQIVVVIGCAEKYGGSSWSVISISNAIFDQTEGFDRTGEVIKLIVPRANWSIGMKRDVATEFVRAEDPTSFMLEAARDRRISYFDLALFGSPPVQPANMRGKLVILGLKRFVAGVREAAELAK